MKIDETDLKIIYLLKKDSSLSTKEISKAIRIPITTIHNRIKKLKQEGIIKKYTILTDDKKLGKGLDVFILVGIQYSQIEGKGKTQEDVAKEIKKLSQVEEVAIVTGMHDMVVRAKEENIDKLNEFIINHLRKVPGVSKTQTMVILKNFS